MVKRYQNSNHMGYPRFFEISVKMNPFSGANFWNGDLCAGSSSRGFLFLGKNVLWHCETSPFWKKRISFLDLYWFWTTLKNGSQGQTTMLMRCTAKSLVESKSPFPEISHHDPQIIGQPLDIVPWSECQQQFPSGADDDALTFFPSG